MKKLALLLAALGVVSAAAYAAPELRVTSIGQEIEIENDDHNSSKPGKGDLDDVWLFNNVGLAYGDWTFGLQAGKQWTANLDDDNGKDKGVKSDDSRLQIDVWNKVTDDLKLGFRYRGSKTYDRFYARWDYNHGMFWSAGDAWYQAESATGASNDTLQFEVFPIGLKYGAFKVGYFLNYVKTLGDTSVLTPEKESAVKEDYIEHQIRAYATLYKGERLTVTTEGRFTISADESYEKPTSHREYDDFGRTRIYLGADYKVTENLNVYGKYGYEFRDWRLEDGNKDDHTGNAYQDFIVGWSYKF